LGPAIDSAPAASGRLGLAMRRSVRPVAHQQRERSS